jgi:leucyl aminopeptidase
MDPMKFETSLVVRNPEEYEGPLLVAIIAQGGLPAALAGVDRAAGGALQRVIATGDFKGKRDDVAVAYGTGPVPRVVLVGAGTIDTASRAAVRRAAAIGVKRARIVGVPSAALWCAPEVRSKVGTRDCHQVLAEGAAQGAWHYLEMKQPPDEPKPVLGLVEILAAADERADAEAGHRLGAAIGAGHLLARGVQVLPPNVCDPAYLAGVAQEIAGRYGFGITVLDRPAIEREGMRALIAVGQGSAQDPRFIALEYRGGGSGAPIVLIGKGMTFDSGGISIKPAQSMEDMKYDMSGAAAVLGALEAIGQIKPAVNVIGLVPSAENMPSGTAYRPADVVKSHLGKTIEVVNTDAEGRLILADAMSYARRYQPACVLDIATLTGAITIALGPIASGLMGTDAKLIAEVLAAGERAHERAWELPLWDEYRDLIKSDIADMKNSGGRAAGSITAAWFLREFAEGLSWAHLDIAGTAYTDREDATMVRGPTAVGVRLFVEFVLARVST